MNFLKKINKYMILLLVLTYLVLLFDFKIKYENNNTRYTIKYIGLLWVALDLYTINKYNSNDIPKKWIEYSEKIIQEK